MIVADGVFVTMAGPAEAMLIRGDRIVAVGSAEEIRAAAP